MKNIRSYYTFGIVIYVKILYLVHTSNGSIYLLYFLYQLYLNIHEK